MNTPTELTPELLGNRETVRQNAKGGEQIMSIALDRIEIREHFNVRKELGDIESLAQSILKNGQTVPGRVDVLKTGMFVLVDGHRRFAALKYLEENGESPLFRAIVNNSKTTEAERILQMFTTNDNKKLEPIETAELFQRLINMGWKAAEVAEKVGCSPAHVSNMLSIAKESPEVKQHIKDGNISATEVLKAKKAIPVESERREKISAAVERISASKEKKKANAKDVTGPNYSKAEKIFKAIESVLAMNEIEKQEVFEVLKRMV